MVRYKPVARAAGNDLFCRYAVKEEKTDRSDELRWEAGKVNKQKDSISRRGIGVGGRFKDVRVKIGDRITHYKPRFQVWDHGMRET